MTKTYVVVHVSYDGATTLMGGVGCVGQNNISAIEYINKSQNRIAISSVVITPKYDADLPDNSPACRAKTYAHCEKTGGEVYEVDNNMPSDILGGAPQFNYLSKQAAFALKDIFDKYRDSADQFIVLLQDASFSKTIKFYLEMGFTIPVNCRIIWIPHHSTRLYCGGKENFDSYAEGWYQYETEAVAAINQHRIQMGCINNKMRREWIDNYGVDSELAINLDNGIMFDRFSKKLTTTEITQLLEQFTIPTDKRLMFSMGRGVPIKGHDQVLKCFHTLLPKNADLHLVLLAPRMQENSGYPEELEQMIEQLNLIGKVTLIKTFESELPLAMLQHEQTAIIMMASREDPLPLVLMEARQSPNRAILLASDRGGMPETIEHGLDGFLFEYGERGAEKIEDAVEKAQQILNLSPEEREAIVATAHRKVRRKFDLVANLANCLFPELQRLGISQSSLAASQRIDQTCFEQEETASSTCEKGQGESLGMR